jgi:hypothetical protein
MDPKSKITLGTNENGYKLCFFTLLLKAPHKILREEKNMIKKK